MPHPGLPSAQQLANLRRANVLALADGSRTYREIAELCGISRQRVWQIVQAAEARVKPGQPGQPGGRPQISRSRG